MSVYAATVKSRTSTTPSSILKKKASLISRLNQSVASTPTKVRFVLPHSTNIRSLLKNYVGKGDRDDVKKLDYLIKSITNYKVYEILDSDVSSILQEATQCISLLNQKSRVFIDSLLVLNWFERSQSVIEEYQSFIVNLISAHTYYAELVITRMVERFFPCDDGEPVLENGIVRQKERSKKQKKKDDREKCLRVHSLLNTILSTVPMCKDLLVRVSREKFPYQTKSTHVHKHYLRNLLWVLEYLPEARTALLDLIIEKLIILDTNAPKEEIEKYRLEKIDIEDEIFDLDYYVARDKMQQTSEKLDICLNMMFDYLIAECHDSESGDLDWSKTKEMYQSLTYIFDKRILSAHKIHHVQFIMFLFCSFKSTITEAFLNFLWKKVCNLNEDAVYRQYAINYIVSFVARSTFVPSTMVKGILQQMAGWIHSYLEAQDDIVSVNSDVRTHSVFYTVCQALFYIIAFLHKDLTDSKKKLRFLESLGLTRIVTCRLNPFRVCQPAVVQNFVSAAQLHQLVYCQTVVEHNSRTSLPMIYRDEIGSTVMSDNRLEAFYPFDPCILERCCEKIQPNYRNYEEIKIQRKRKLSDIDRDKADIDEDDFLESKDEDSSKMSKFSYGSSPGFKIRSD